MPDPTSQSTGPITVAANAAKEYADLIVKGPLGELGGMLTDAIGQWRLRNQVRLLLRTKDWLERKGVKPQLIRPDLFVPLVNAATDTSDENLSDMFASLLATQLDPETSENSHPSYAGVLTQLSPIDAKAMVLFSEWVSHKEAREVGLPGPGITVEHVAQDLEISARVAHLSCLNLHRLGITEHTGYSPPQGHPTSVIFEHSPEHQRYRITEYGVAFCQACRYARAA